MKWLLRIALVVPLLTGIGILAWGLAELPPVRLVWRHGFSHGPSPTGTRLSCEGVEFVEIGPGCFRMGSWDAATGGDRLGRWCARLGLPWGKQPKPSREMPVHWVEIPRGFSIARTELTNAQFEAFDSTHERTPYSPGDRDPVVDVSWEDARLYCAWLSERSGLSIRLPTESEWECACRAGTNREYSFGNNAKLLANHAWYRANSDRHAHEVAGQRANAWGLHDFHGNVYEWCEDAWHEDYVGAPADGSAWMEGGKIGRFGLHRVYRGGCWDDSGPGDCRSAFRLGNPQSIHDGTCGFRVAFTRSPE